MEYYDRVITDQQGEPSKRTSRKIWCETQSRSPIRFANVQAAVHMACPARFLATCLGALQAKAMLRELYARLPLQPPYPYHMLTFPLGDGTTDLNPLYASLWVFGLHTKVVRILELGEPEHMPAPPDPLAIYLGSYASSSGPSGIVLLGLTMRHPGTHQLQLFPIPPMYTTALAQGLCANSANELFRFMYFFSRYIAREHPLPDVSIEHIHILLSCVTGGARTVENAKEAWRILLILFRKNAVMTRVLMHIADSQRRIAAIARAQRKAEEEPMEVDGEHQ